MSQTINAAAVQAAPVLFDTPKTLAKLADLTREAAASGADLVVFPEAFVGAIPRVWISARGLERAAPKAATISDAISKAPSTSQDRRQRASAKSPVTTPSTSSWASSSATAEPFIARR